MSDDTCKLDSCTTKPGKGKRGFCSRHYRLGLEDGSLPRVWDGSPKRCSVEDCARKYLASGYCGLHWARWRKHGDPNFVHVRTRSVCVEDGCEKIVVSHGLCGTHDWRLRNHGSTTLPAPPTLAERFWAQVDTSGGPDACHPWTGIRDPDNYGIFASGPGATRRPHRWLLGHLRGKPLGRDEYACHHCDNPPCCNPEHLYVGTPLSNMQDKMAHGRHRPGRKKSAA